MKPKDEPPRRYGRQGEGKTIKSISLESDVALFAEMLAEESGLSLSAMINQILKQDADKKTASRKEKRTFSRMVIWKSWPRKRCLASKRRSGGKSTSSGKAGRLSRRKPSSTC